LFHTQRTQAADALADMGNARQVSSKDHYIQSFFSGGFFYSSFTIFKTI